MSGYDSKYTGLTSGLNGNGGGTAVDPEPVSIERVVMTRDYCGAYTYRNGAIERILMGNGFLSPDPYVQLPDFTQSLNRYSYCWNNPLSRVDLSGLDSWYTNDKNEILAFLNEYKRRRGLFPGSSMEDWLNNRSGWEYEGEGLNRIDLDRMRLYTTRNEILGGYSVIDNEHVNLNEIVLTTFVYNLTRMNYYDSYSFSFISNDFNSKVGAVNSIVGYALANSKHTYRLTNSFGQFDPHYYTSGFKANQYVRTTPIAKYAPFFRRLGKVSNIYSLYNSCNGLINSTTERDRFENGLDMVMAGIGYIKNPVTIGLSTFWSLGGKELFWLYNDNVITLEIELGIVGLPSTMPFK